MRQATRVASLTGQVIAYLFILFGIWLFFTGDILDGIWLGFIGWFLLSAAQSANAQGVLTSVLRGVTVGEVMNPKPATVPADIPLQQLVDAYFLPGGLRSALVMDADHLVGLMTLSDIRHIPRDRVGTGSRQHRHDPACAPARCGTAAELERRAPVNGRSRREPVARARKWRPGWRREPRCHRPVSGSATEPRCREHEKRCAQPAASRCLKNHLRGKLPHEKMEPCP